LKTSCAPPARTSDAGRVAFGDAYRNEAHAARLPTGGSGLSALERCGTDTFRVAGPYGYDMCHSGRDGRARREGRRRAVPGHAAMRCERRRHTRAVPARSTGAAPSRSRCAEQSTPPATAPSPVTGAVTGDRRCASTPPGVARLRGREHGRLWPVKQREAARRRCFRACYWRGCRRCLVEKTERTGLLQCHLVFLVDPLNNWRSSRCNPKTKKSISG
jgi:hypothetical protein